MTTAETPTDLREVVAVNMPAMAALLRAARIARGWSQQDVSDQVGCSPHMVSLWETGSNAPRPERFTAWAGVFGYEFALVAATGPAALGFDVDLSRDEL